MITKSPLWSLEFYPGVLENIEAMPDGLSGKFAAYFEVMQDVGGDLGMPRTRPLGDRLFELRAKANGNIGRILFCYEKGRVIVLLSAFVKKQQKTPKREIDLARKRMTEI